MVGKHPIKPSGGGERMNKKLFSVLIGALVISLMLTPFAIAVPGAEKSNEKIKSWQYEKEVSFGVLLMGEHEYIPSLEKPNKLVITSEEGFISYQITVDGRTYVQGVDFDCVDVFTKYVANKPVFDPEGLGDLWPSESQTAHLLVYTTFDFSVYEGSIEGQLRIMERSSSGNTHTTSVWGTEDLQNVVLQATYYNTMDPDATPFPVLTVYDDGTVIGWPDKAPL